MRIELNRRIVEKSARDLYTGFQSKIDSDLFQKLIALDPLTNGDIVGPYADWIVKKYLKLPEDAKQRFLSEDAEQVKRGLLVFSKLTKNKEGLIKLAGALPEKPSNLKDINAYSFGQIRMLASLMDEKGSEDLGTKAEKQVEVLVNTQSMLALIPKTHEAARKYGTGTSWCTATSDSYYYNRYSEEGPLIIIIDKENPKNKWQYHDASHQFMNPEDRGVTVSKVAQYWVSKGDDYAESFDTLASILETKFGYKEWSFSTIEQSLKKTIQSLSKTLGAVPPSQYNRYRFKDGTSIIGFCVLKDFTDVADYFGEKYHVKPITTDLYKAVSDINVSAARYLTDRDPTLIERMFDAAASSSTNKEMGSISEACVKNTLMAQLLISRLQTLSLQEKMEYLFDDRKPFFSKSFIESLVDRKGEKADAFLMKLLTDLFGEYDKLSEAKRTLNLPSFESIFEPGIDKGIKERIKAQLNGAIGPYEEFFPTTHRWLGRTDLNTDLSKTLNIDSIMLRALQGDEKAQKAYAIARKKFFSEHNGDPDDGPDHDAWLKTIYTPIINYIASASPAQLKSLLEKNENIFEDIHEVNLGALISLCLSRADGIIIQNKKRATNFYQYSNVADLEKIIDSESSHQIGNKILSVLQGSIADLQSAYEAYLTVRDLYLEGLAEVVSYASLKGVRAMTNARANNSQLEAVITPIFNKIQATLQKVRGSASSLGIIPIWNFDVVIEGTKNLLGSADWGDDAFAYPTPININILKERQQAKMFADILTSMDPVLRKKLVGYGNFPQAVLRFQAGLARNIEDIDLKQKGTYFDQQVLVDRSNDFHAIPRSFTQNQW